MSRQLTIINIETHKLSVLRSAREAIELWCPDCDAMVSMLIPETAAMQCAATPREIYRRLENGELHFIETGAGELFVCSRSLSKTPTNDPVK